MYSKVLGEAFSQSVVLLYFFWNSGCTGACPCLYCFSSHFSMLGKMLEQSCFPTHSPCPEEWAGCLSKKVPDRQSSAWSWSWSHLFISKHLLYEMQINNTVHPQNVRFQNVRFQNVWNVRFTKRQVYKMSGLQNVLFTKRQVFKTSGSKKHPYIFCTCGWWKSTGSVAAMKWWLCFFLYFRGFLPYITIIANNK